jgi:hypothetical protein
MSPDYASDIINTTSSLKTEGHPYDKAAGTFLPASFVKYASRMFSRQSVDPMILHGAGDITQLVSVDYQHSAVGSGQTPLSMTLKCFFGRMQKVLTSFYVSGIRITALCLP